MVKHGSKCITYPFVVQRDSIFICVVNLVILYWSFPHFNWCVFQVLPNMASVADIKAISYDICGVVRMVGSGNKVKVISKWTLLASGCI